MKRLFINHIAVFVLLNLILSCGSSKDDAKGNMNEKKGLIYLSQEQFETEKIVLGSPSNVLFSNSITCTGYLTAPPKSIAKINTILSGRIEAIHCSLGEQVKKGQLLALLSSSLLIEMQQDYLKAIAEMKMVEAEYIRKKDLYDDNIATEKEFLMAESEYKLIQADIEAFSLKLNRLQLDLNKVRNGKLYANYPIYSPIDGFVTQLNMVMGDYIEPQEIALEVIDVSKLELSLSVFEKNMPDLEIGLPVKFQFLNKSNQTYSANISSIVKRLDPDSRSIECRASVRKSKGVAFIHGASVQADIITSEAEAMALPIEAFQKDGESYYIFVIKERGADGFYIEKVEVETGQVSKTHIEITNPKIEADVLVSGIYNLLT